MSQLDELKEEVSWYKAIFLALFAADASVIAWLFNRFEDASDAQLWMATFAIATLSLMLIFIHIKAFKRIKKMESL
ncbi:hypothetical protein [Hydrogenovibrio halophilus]|uniref:hypothetical protein n=1 Tax=Hydrogenovibrio halophilus TaxID=373391 RepID=UPI00035EFB95|nr:hypothetical protein [Hydrogenovibrio halophilus]